MVNCEIVENTACGQAFKYCRTHKVEAHDCPIHAQVAESLRAFEIAPRHMAPKREFKEGDKVKIVDCGVFPELMGQVVTIKRVNDPGSIYVTGPRGLEPTRETYYSFDPYYCFPAKCFEAAR